MAGMPPLLEVFSNLHSIRTKKKWTRLLEHILHENNEKTCLNIIYYIWAKELFISLKYCDLRTRHWTTNLSVRIFSSIFFLQFFVNSNLIIFYYKLLSGSLVYVGSAGLPAASLLRRGIRAQCPPKPPTIPTLDLEAVRYLL